MKIEMVKMFKLLKDKLYPYVVVKCYLIVIAGCVVYKINTWSIKTFTLNLRCHCLYFLDKIIFLDAKKIKFLWFQIIFIKIVNA